MKKIGLIINPIAGMGGRVGLKGTDGADTLQKAISLGAKAEAENKTVKALLALQEAAPENSFIIYTCSGKMGEYACQKAGISPIIVYHPDAMTGAQDTKNAVEEMQKRNMDCLVFAGGDGTARNICQAVGDQALVLGIPAGVKIHSAVFATKPTNAGKLLAAFCQNKTAEKESEVMDIDEDAFRNGQVSARLYGYLRIIYAPNLVQSLKSGGVFNNKEANFGIADYMIDHMEKDVYYLIGAGTTTRAIMERLRLPYTLLGVDIVQNKKLICQDANEKEILEMIDNKPFKIVVSVIGGQGYIFGRGNQQFSPVVLQKAGKENIQIIATLDKLVALQGKPLLLDTGDSVTDKLLAGFYQVLSGYDEHYVYQAVYE